MIPFERIETILLDMDGTILDKYYDDFFWEVYVPQKFAEKNSMTFEEAQRTLFAMYKAEEGTLNWTDIDFWSKRTGLDIPALKKEIDYLIAPHPDSEEFLEKINFSQSRVYLVTNAHNWVMELKLRKTGFYKYFHECFTSFDIGYPKESPKFWEVLFDRTAINPEKTLFIDDTEQILHTAKSSGIKYPILRAISSSKAKPKTSEHFITINSFRDIMPF